MVLTHLTTPHRFFSVNSKSSKESMADRVVSPRWAMLFFEILPITDKKRRGVVWCANALMVLAHPLMVLAHQESVFEKRRLKRKNLERKLTRCAMLFFHRRRAVKTLLLWLDLLGPSHTKKTPRFFACFSLKFYCLPTPQAS